MDRTGSFGDLIGESAAMHEIFALIRKVAHGRSNVLISEISSRKMVPPLASWNMPARVPTAPVNDPFSCPNISLSSSSVGMALQLTPTKGPCQRSE